MHTNDPNERLYGAIALIPKPVVGFSFTLVAMTIFAAVQFLMV